MLGTGPGLTHVTQPHTEPIAPDVLPLPPAPPSQAGVTLLVIASIAALVGIGLIMRGWSSTSNSSSTSSNSAGNDNRATPAPIDFASIEDVGALIGPDREDPATTWPIDPATTLDPATLDAARLDAIGPAFIAAWQGREPIDGAGPFDLRRMVWEMVQREPDLQRKTMRFYWSMRDPQRGTTTADLLGGMLSAQLDGDRQRRATQPLPTRIERFRTEPIPGRPELVTWWRVAGRDHMFHRYALWLIRSQDDGRFRIYDVLDEQSFLRLTALLPLVHCATMTDLGEVTQLQIKIAGAGSLMQRIKNPRLDVPRAEIEDAIADSDLAGWHSWFGAALVKQLVAGKAPAEQVLAEVQRQVQRGDVNPTLWVWVGQFHLLRSEWAPAADAFGKYLAVAGPDEQVSTACGRCLARSDRSDAAVATWQAWLDIAPRPGVCHMEVAKFWRDAKRPQKAMPVLAAVLMSDAADSWSQAEARSELDRLIEDAGTEGAAVVKDAISRLEPAARRPADALLYLARAHAALGETADAVRVLSFFLAEPGAASRESQTAALLDLLDLEQPRDPAAAAAWLDRYGASLARSESHALVLRAEVAGSAGDLATALALLEQAATLDRGSIRWLERDALVHVSGARALMTDKAIRARVAEEWLKPGDGGPYVLPETTEPSGWRRRTGRDWSPR
ncbi:MAG: tetratricopeptide repeat protein [Planctomycetota bacterium]